jgi:hypothetical protein
MFSMRVNIYIASVEGQRRDYAAELENMKEAWQPHGKRASLDEGLRQVGQLARGSLMNTIVISLIKAPTPNASSLCRRFNTWE